MFPGHCRWIAARWLASLNRSCRPPCAVNDASTYVRTHPWGFAGNTRPLIPVCAPKGGLRADLLPIQPRPLPRSISREVSAANGRQGQHRQPNQRQAGGFRNSSRWPDRGTGGARRAWGWRASAIVWRQGGGRTTNRAGEKVQRRRQECRGRWRGGERLSDRHRAGWSRCANGGGRLKRLDPHNGMRRRGTSQGREGCHASCGGHRVRQFQPGGPRTGPEPPSAGPTVEYHHSYDAGIQ